MDTPLLPDPDPSLYERDFHAWCLEQAAHLRGRIRPGASDALDYENLAEEIETLGRSNRHAIRSHLRNLLIHLLKWQFQPDKRTPSWERSIVNARDEIEYLIKDSPSLASLPGELLAEQYPRALADAAAETGMPESAFPAACPYTVAQVLDPDFLP
jgi:hypothetical protein